MIHSVRLAGMAALVLGFVSFASEATPVSAQPGIVQSALPAPNLAETMKGKPLVEQVDAYGRVETDGAEQDCLANAVYFEARGESLEGQLAVAEVVLNRSTSGRYPTTLCGVVTQPAQFSFVRNRRIPAANRSSEAWRKAVAIARIAQDKTADLLTDDVLWYHADYVAPSWGRRLERTDKIGVHIFYR